MAGLLDQPTELVIEQFKLLPIEDLLAICQTNSQFAQICQAPELWREKIKIDFPELDLSKIPDPRKFYLNQVLFIGEIYTHQRRHVQSIPHERIPYRRLLEIIEYTAKATGYPYLILYSRPDSENEVSLKPIAVQGQAGYYYLSEPAEKITQVDIILDPDVQLLHKLDDALFFLNLPIINVQEQIEFNAGNTKVIIDHRKYLKMRRQHSMLPINLIGIVLQNHENANTVFYQRETNLIMNKSLSQSLIAPISEPTIDLQTRKQNLLNFILQVVTPNNFTLFSTYQEFANFQREYIDRLNEGQLSILEQLRSQLIPMMEYHNTDMKIEFYFTGFFIRPNGKIVLI